MKTDPTKLYMMPHIIGPLYDVAKLTRILYPHTETVALQFQTDREAAIRLMPDCYEVDQIPIVTVIFAYHTGLDFMAGGGYNLAAFQVSARFDGKRDHVEGEYNLIMFENQTRPILGGREFLGVPKRYADIPPFKIMDNGNLRCEASLWGHHLFGIELPPQNKQNPIVKHIAAMRINSRPWLAYKYIPALDGPSDADYPTITKNDVKIKTLWMGSKGSLTFGTAKSSDVEESTHVIDALKTLPLIKVVQVIHFIGSAMLRYDQSHRLI